MTKNDEIIRLSRLFCTTKDDYVIRNRGDFSIASNIALFSKILYRTNGIDSLLEIGANIGLNLKAIKQLLPQVKLSVIEVNQKAVEELEKMGGGDSLSSRL